MFQVQLNIELEITEMLEQGTWLQSTVHSENVALLGHYTVSSGNFLPTFWDNLLVPTPLKMGPIGCLEMSVRNYHYLLCNNPEGCRSHLLWGGSLKSCILCILAARQSYCYHYCRMAFGPKITFCVLVFHEMKSIISCNDAMNNRSEL
jgi:hypothetical protein